MTTAPPEGTRPEDPEEEEVYPPDFIYALIDFMEDVCRIEAHVWAAEQALRDARVIDERHLADGGLEATLGRERAYFLLDSAADAAEEAAERAHKLRPELVAYCSRQRIELWRKLDAEDEAREAGRGVMGEAGQEGNAGDVTEAPPGPAKVVEPRPEASEPKDPGSKSGRKGRRKGGRA
ncbi:MAG TPA: hypothetical protein VH877_18665 [Polyangia bacterium]|jgi:hypothetical protein|nr:hypothetical protein [Polyangia bacterium]